jgi:carotenoid cleavage dioxygenase-like enzyme
MRIKDGKATYVSRYVKTARFKQEEYFGGAKFMKVSFSDSLQTWILFIISDFTVNLAITISDLFYWVH